MKLSELTNPEVNRYLRECNFTKDEQVFFSKSTEDFTQEEIAELMNISVSTVKRIKTKVLNKILKVDLFLN